MPTPQHPIDSGFGARSTAAEVLEGIDLSGRLAIVTGGYSGLGLETVRALSGAGADVIVPARRPRARRRGARRRSRAPRSSSSTSATSTASSPARSRCSTRGRSVDILINNAAIMACPETRVGPGWEAQFATNHLGHFALDEPALAAAGGRRRRARRRALLDRAQALADPLRRPAVRARLREVAGLRPGQDRQQPVRRPARRARPGRRRARLRGPPGRDHDAAAAPPLARGDDRLGLDRRGGQPRRALQDARAGRLDLDLGGDVAGARRAGRRLLRELRHRDGRPSRLARAHASRASTPTRSTATTRRGCGRSRRSSPASTRSRRPRGATAACRARPPPGTSRAPGRPCAATRRSGPCSGCARRRRRSCGAMPRSCSIALFV